MAEVSNLEITQLSELPTPILLYSDSLFQRLKSYELPIQSTPALELTREMVAASMIADEIHEDVHQFFNKLSQLSG